DVDDLTEPIYGTWWLVRRSRNPGRVENLSYSFQDLLVCCFRVTGACNKLCKQSLLASGTWCVWSEHRMIGISLSKSADKVTESFDLLDLSCIWWRVVGKGDSWLRRCGGI